MSHLKIIWFTKNFYFANTVIMCEIVQFSSNYPQLNNFQIKFLVFFFNLPSLYYKIAEQFFKKIFILWCFYVSLYFKEWSLRDS